MKIHCMTIKTKLKEEEVGHAAQGAKLIYDMIVSPHKRKKKKKVKSNMTNST